METKKCIFNEDPLYMKSLVGKEVKINTVGDKTFTGIVYVIDPESKTVVLSTKGGSKVNLDFILCNTIKSFDVTSEAVVDEDFLFEKNVPKLYADPEELKSKKLKLKEWLRENHIFVQEEGNLLKLDGHFIIEPPYGPGQCVCKNTIVLSRLRTVMESMPS